MKSESEKQKQQPTCLHGVVRKVKVDIQLEYDVDGEFKQEDFKDALALLSDRLSGVVLMSEDIVGTDDWALLPTSSDMDIYPNVSREEPK